MKVSEPIGNAEWAPFFVRITLGCYFMIKGFWGMDNSLAFSQELGRHSGGWGDLMTAYGILAPYLFVVVGGLVIAGFWTTAAGIGAGLLLLPYLWGNGVLHGGLQSILNRNSLKDLMLLAGAISLLFSGAGALSVDKFRKAG
jgi:uncharacterized membrane protein YphA (DoxX/SURF4 family)